MRQIGSLGDHQQAQLIADYLTAKGMSAQCRSERPANSPQDSIPEASQPTVAEWSIWVHEENDVDPAKQILAEFKQNPEADEYQSLVVAHQHATEKRIAERIEAQTGTPDPQPPAPTPFSGTNEPLSRRAPLVLVLVGLTLFVGLVTDGGKLKNDLFHALMTVDLRGFSESDPSSAWSQIQQGQLWRLVTPVFLHGGWLHLLFNLSWLYYFGVQIEFVRGTVRFGCLVLTLAIVSNLTQLWWAGPNFIGMSGVAYGLFGYIWAKQIALMGRRPTYVLSEFSIFVMMFFMVMGFAQGKEGMFAEGTAVANGAHVGGLLAGMLISFGAAFLESRQVESEKKPS